MEVYSPGVLRKSRINVLTALGFFRGFWGKNLFMPCSWLLETSGDPWHSLLIDPSFLLWLHFHITFSFVCVSFSSFLSLRRMCVIGFTAHELIDDGLILRIFCIVKYAKTLFTNKTTFTGSRGTKLLGATSWPVASSYCIIILLSCCASPKLSSLYFFLGTNFFISEPSM